MDQFNRILAAFLVLVVAVGISVFIFSRLGILNKIFPNMRLSAGSDSTISQSPTPTKAPVIAITSPTPTAGQGGFLGWLASLRKSAPTPTTTPTPALARTTPSPIPTVRSDNTITDTGHTALPENIVVPYGSTEPTQYPASGAETLVVPLSIGAFVLGRYLHTRAK